MSGEGLRRSPGGSAAVEPIAIVGMACRFPGAADVDSFWRLLRDGGDAIRPMAREGLDLARFYDPRPKTPGRMMTQWAGLLDDLELFDADFFGISPREAEKLDPAQRLVLETAWEACEDAGIDTASLAGRPVGVFIGQWLSDFESRLFADLDGVDFHSTTGSGRYATAGRLSYVLGLTGPSISVDTACSSSLVAVHLACQSLRTGETPLAFAAGVNVILQPHISVAYSQSGMMAPDGHCKFGDADGDGYVRSEGVGVLLLKRLSDAVADGDTIHAVIRGSAVNNDGRGSGHLATPSREGQAAMLEAAYANAGVAPGDVEYVEAHGTGTRVGDPVEIGALGDVLAVNRDAGSRCYVGSVKTNIGHTEGAAGMAGLLKCILALKHGEIPASLHFRNPNPAIPWEELPFNVPKESVAWPRGPRARIAGVSGFGIAGTNAHVVLEEAPGVADRGQSAKLSGMPAAAESRPWPLVLSAATAAALRALASEYADRLSGPDAPSLHDLCASAALHRTALPERAVFVASDRATLVERLRRFASGDEQAADVARRATGDAARRIAFVFPGQGGQWLGMARELLATEPHFADVVTRCDAALPAGTAWTVREQLLADPESKAYRLTEISVLQPVLVVVEIALAEYWRLLGVEPDAVVGHSMGEVGAAYFAGALSLEDAMLIICARSRLLQRTSGAGAMAVLELSAEETSRRIAPYGDKLCVAVVNGPRATVISGEPDAVAAIRADCEREGLFCRAVQVDVASHSPQMDPLVPELVVTLASVRPYETTTALYSTVDASLLDGLRADAAYWGRNLRSSVLFASTVDRMLADGIDAFIEVSPHPALLVSIAQVADARGDENARPVALQSLRRNEPERATLLASLGGLWAVGHRVEWTRVFPGGEYTRVALPHYRWQRERYWPELAAIGQNGAASRDRSSLDDTHRDWLYVSRWAAAPVEGNDVPRRWLVIGDTSRGAGALSEALIKAGATATAHATTDGGARALAASSEGVHDVGIVVLVDDRESQLGWRAVQQLRAFQDAHANSVTPRMWWVTSGAHRVANEMPSASAAEQGALWGAARVLASEHPDWWGGLVDLDAGAAPASQWDALAKHLVGSRSEDQVALRNGVRFALRLAHAAPALAKTGHPFTWRPDGAYLITGAFGGVAQRIALEMARQGARRFVLLGRNALPPRAKWSVVASDDPLAGRIAFVRELEHTGAAVHLLHADVGDEIQLARALAEYAEGGWPPIVGVVHAAGVLDSRLTEDMNAEAFARVVHGKLDGAMALDRLLPQLDIFIAFSSMMAFWAPPSMSNYAAANAGLDALVVARRARGQRAVSIQFGPWEGLGLYRGSVDQGSADELTRDGVRSFAPDEGARFLAPILAGSEAVVAVLPIDWSVFAAARRGREPALYRDLIAQPATLSTAGSSDSLRAKIEAAADPTRRMLIESAVRSAVGAVLRRPAEQLDAARPFGSMGLDSLMALELRNRLETAIERSLPATIAWNYPTVTQLATHLDALIARGVAAAPGDAASDAPKVVTAEPSSENRQTMSSDVFAMESLLGDVAQLSDEDAARALRGGA